MSRARVRAVALATVSGILISIVAALMLPVGAITLFARGGCTHGSPRCRAERSLPSTVCGFACTIPRIPRGTNGLYLESLIYS